MTSSFARRAVAGGVLALALIGCASNLTPEPPPPSVSPSVHATTDSTAPSAPPIAVRQRDMELQALIDDWSAVNDPVGIAAAARFPDGDLWVGSAGLADREHGIDVEPTDRFEIASLTKVFMSVLTLRLAEEGAIDLDAPISACLPEFPAAHQITIRMLLGHRAGVRDPSSDLVSDRIRPPDPEKVFSPTELVDAAASGTPTFLPGSRHEYSNANYWILAALPGGGDGPRHGDASRRARDRPARLGRHAPVRRLVAGCRGC